MANNNEMDVAPPPPPPSRRQQAVQDVDHHQQPSDEEQEQQAVVQEEAPRRRGGPPGGDGSAVVVWLQACVVGGALMWSCAMTVGIVVVMTLVIVNRDKLREKSNDSSVLGEPIRGTPAPVAATTPKPTTSPTPRPVAFPTPATTTRNPTFAPTPKISAVSGACFPSDLSCDASSADAGECLSVQLILTTNECTSFWLGNVDGDTNAIAWSYESGSLRSFTYYEFETWICSTRCYLFYIQDNAGDSLYCTNAQVVFQLFVQGNLVLEGSDFGSYSEIYLAEGCPGPTVPPTTSFEPSVVPTATTTISIAPTHSPKPTPQPTVSNAPSASMMPTMLVECFEGDAACRVPCAWVNLTFVTDSYPSENSFSLTNAFTDAVAWSYSDFDAVQTLTYGTAVCPTECYHFVMLDSFGDGLCCDGRFELLYTGNVVLADASIGFGSEIFLGEGCPSMGPSPAPTNRATAVMSSSSTSSPGPTSRILSTEAPSPPSRQPQQQTPTVSTRPVSDQPQATTTTATTTPFPTISSTVALSNSPFCFENSTDLREAVRLYLSNAWSMELSARYGSTMASWCVSKISNFTRLFAYRSTFSEDLSNWTMTGATDVSEMFRDASSFNADISDWDVSKVTNMALMFRNANAFNQNLAGWNVSRVETMGSMFEGSYAFGQNLCAWGDKLPLLAITDGAFASTTSCPTTLDPNMTHNPPGPFCHVCS